MAPHRTLLYLASFLCYSAPVLILQKSPSVVLEWTQQRWWKGDWLWEQKVGLQCMRNCQPSKFSSPQPTGPRLSNGWFSIEGSNGGEAAFAQCCAPRISERVKPGIVKHSQKDHPSLFNLFQLQNGMACFLGSSYSFPLSAGPPSLQYTGMWLPSFLLCLCLTTSGSYDSALPLPKPEGSWKLKSNRFTHAPLCRLLMTEVRCTDTSQH